MTVDSPAHAAPPLLAVATRFSYGLAPLGTPEGSTAKFGFAYNNVDMQAFVRALEWRDMDLRGRVSGTNDMTWHNGQFSKTMTGTGHAFVTPPPGSPVATAALPASPPPPAPELTPFDKTRTRGPLPVAGELVYRLDPNGLDIEPSWAATAATYLAFHGRADYGARSDIPFHVTSFDWQASDRLLAAILSAAGGPTSAVEVGGHGQFDGVMTGPFSQPRVAGRFTGENVKAWGTRWGHTTGDIVIESTRGTVTHGTAPGAPDGASFTERFEVGGTTRYDGEVNEDGGEEGHSEEAGRKRRQDRQEGAGHARLQAFGHAFCDACGHAFCDAFGHAFGDLRIPLASHNERVRHRAGPVRSLERD